MGGRALSLALVVVVVAAAVLGLVLGGVLPFRAPPVPTAPDLIFHHGTVLTMEGDRPRAQAVAVGGDHIVAVGGDDEILALRTETTRTVDLGGRTLLPGFIDSHAHWVGDRARVGFSTPKEAVQAALENGWTSISELFVNRERLRELRALDDAGDLRVRVNAYLPLSWQLERFGTWYQDYEPGQEFSPNLRIGGVKIFVDSWLWGELLFSQGELSDLVAEAHGAGFQVAAHATGTGALDLILSAYEGALQGASNAIYRHRIEHVVMVRDDQLDRMRQLGAIASIQLTWFHSDWIPAVQTELRPEDAGKVARWRDLLRAGVPAIGSTDYPWGVPPVASSIKAIHQAVTRIGDQGILPPLWMLNQRITVEEALRLLTIDAAYGTFQEELKGSLAPDKFADLVVLSENPLSVPEERLRDIQVLMVMVGGKVEHCAPGQEALCPGPEAPRRQAQMPELAGRKSEAPASAGEGRDLLAAEWHGYPWGGGPPQNRATSPLTLSAAS